MSIFRFLSPGFRHCFCLLEDRGQWILCDPLWAALELRAYPIRELDDPAAHFAAAGATVLAGRRLRSPTAGPSLAPITCVEVVKRAVGLRAPWVLTPKALAAALLRLPAETRFRRVD